MKVVDCHEIGNEVNSLRDVWYLSFAFPPKEPYKTDIEYRNIKFIAHVSWEGTSVMLKLERDKTKFKRFKVIPHPQEYENFVNSVDSWIEKELEIHI